MKEYMLKDKYKEIEENIYERIYEDSLGNVVLTVEISLSKNKKYWILRTFLSGCGIGMRERTFKYPEEYSMMFNDNEAIAIFLTDNDFINTDMGCFLWKGIFNVFTVYVYYGYTWKCRVEGPNLIKEKPVQHNLDIYNFLKECGIEKEVIYDDDIIMIEEDEPTDEEEINRILHLKH